MLFETMFLTESFFRAIFVVLFNFELSSLWMVLYNFN